MASKYEIKSFFTAFKYFFSAIFLAIIYQILYADDIPWTEIRAGILILKANLFPFIRYHVLR